MSSLTLPLHRRLIADWRRAHRYWSVRLASASALLMSVWTALPPDLQARLPFANHIAAGLFVAVAISRLVAQDSRA